MLSLEMHKAMNHTIADKGGRYYGIQGGIPYDIGYALGVGAHGVTYPLGGTPEPVEWEELKMLF
jgi:hypothetical protein